MINPCKLSNLRNAEHLQLMIDFVKILLKYNPDNLGLAEFYNQLVQLVAEEEAVMALETSNAKIKAKNQKDSQRDKLHSSLFNYVKSFVYNENGPLYETACRIMDVLNDVGNPTRLAENAESAMLTTLGNRLTPYRDDLEKLGAQTHLDLLMEANEQFMQLQAECRDIKISIPSSSVKAVRLKIDPVYRNTVNAVNVFRTMSRKDEYEMLVKETNVLIDEYNRLLKIRAPKNN